MTQVIFGVFGDVVKKLSLPNHEDEVIKGVKWGKFDRIFTPAFWAAQAWLTQLEARPFNNRIGETLAEEMAACLIGGYGIPAELGLAAFFHLKGKGLIPSTPPTPGENEIYMALKEPLLVNGKQRYYRFAKQKAHYLYNALDKLHVESPPINDAIALRKWLIEIDGIGLKTSSWIVRNWLESDKIAIIDIHIFRAGVLAGIFRLQKYFMKHYIEMEQKFISFADAINVKASQLDSIMWFNMRNLNRYALALIKEVEI